MTRTNQLLNDIYTDQLLDDIYKVLPSSSYQRIADAVNELRGTKPSAGSPIIKVTASQISKAIAHLRNTARQGNNRYGWTVPYVKNGGMGDDSPRFFATNLDGSIIPAFREQEERRFIAGLISRYTSQAQQLGTTCITLTGLINSPRISENERVMHQEQLKICEQQIAIFLRLVDEGRNALKKIDAWIAPSDTNNKPSH